MSPPAMGGLVLAGLARPMASPVRLVLSTRLGYASTRPQYTSSILTKGNPVKAPIDQSGRVGTPSGRVQTISSRSTAVRTDAEGRGPRPGPD